MAKAALKFRFIEVERTKIDRAARTIPISFSSEHPALQRVDENVPLAIRQAAGLKDGQVYVEILDHGEGNVDLSMLNNRGAFLDEHDEKDQLGVVEKAEVDTNIRRGLAVVKLSSHAKAEARMDQMEKGERPHISAGYKYTRFIGDEKLPNGRLAKRFAFQPMEISSVAIPADATIGVARSYHDLPTVDSPETVDVENVAKKLTPEQ